MTGLGRVRSEPMEARPSLAGKCALIGGCTSIIDEHHAVMAAMGERFLLCRLPEVNPQMQATRALDHVRQEVTVRKELSAAVAGLFQNLEPGTFPIDDGTRDRLGALATFVSLARSAVIRDGYRRDIDLVPGSERPARLVLSLARLLYGMRTIGVSGAEAWRLVTNVAMDCLPDLRKRVFRFLQGRDREPTSNIAGAVGYPTSTARRTLEDLSAHGILKRLTQGPGRSDEWELSLLG